MLIGTIGAAGAGKDTFVKILESFGFERIAFADPLYQEVASAYGVTVEFLGNRQLKELPNPLLCLSKCSDTRYVEVKLKLSFGTRTSKMYKKYILGEHTGVSRRVVKTALKKPFSARRILQTWGTDYRRKSVFGTDSYWLDKVASTILSNPDKDFAISDCRFNNEADFIESIGGVLVRIERPGLAVKAATHISEQELSLRTTFATIINEEGAHAKLIDIAEDILMRIEQSKQK